MLKDYDILPSASARRSQIETFVNKPNIEQMLHHVHHIRAFSLQILWQKVYSRRNKSDPPVFPFLFLSSSCHSKTQILNKAKIFLAKFTSGMKSTGNTSWNSENGKKTKRSMTNYLLILKSKINGLKVSLPYNPKM